MNYKEILERAEEIRKDENVPSEFGDIDTKNPLYDYPNQFISFPIKVAGGSFAGCGCIGLSTFNAFAKYFGNGPYFQLSADVSSREKFFRFKINIFPRDIKAQ